jgi:dipeptidase E
MHRILAIGGGGFLMEESPSPVDALILRLTGKPKPRVCFVSTPSGDLPEHIERFDLAFSSEVCEPSHLAFFRRPGARSIPLGDLESHVLQQDVVYVGGGNTKSALGVWREWGLDETLMRAYEAGVLLCGMSAGAMCWFEAGITDSFWGAGYRPLAGLGLLPGGCAVHYNSDPQRRPRLHAALQARAIPPTIAIDDLSAVLYEEGQLSRVYKWGGGQGAYFAVAEAAGVTETHLEAESLRVEA